MYKYLCKVSNFLKSEKWSWYQILLFNCNYFDDVYATDKISTKSDIMINMKHWNNWI